MGFLKIFSCAVLASLTLASTVWGMSYSPSERLRIFATCAGRLSALEEHQRLFDGPASEITARQKARFDEIIAALLPHAVDHGMPGRQALAWQIEAKMAQAVLLQRAAFHRDSLLASRARSAARTRLSACDGLLLGA